MALPRPSPASSIVRRVRRIGYAGLLVLVFGFIVAAQEPPKAAAQDVPYCDLAKNPGSYVGKMIRVRAIYSYGFEIQVLGPRECCPVRNGLIWVEMSPDMDRHSRRAAHKFPEGMGDALATFSGVFEGPGTYGDGRYRFKLVVRQIENVENTAKASSTIKPKWFPADCKTVTNPFPPD
jgi:hypothetical protein